MITTQDIETAIGAHAMWKRRLGIAIEAGKSEFVPERVEPDHLCDFGKWLYGRSEFDRTSDHWCKVQQLHAVFHREAAQVLRLATQQQKVEAEKRMADGGSFKKASTDLTLAMMEWKNLVDN